MTRADDPRLQSRRTLFDALAQMDHIRTMLRIAKRVCFHPGLQSFPFHGSYQQAATQCWVRSAEFALPFEHLDPSIGGVMRVDAIVDEQLRHTRIES